MGIRFKLSDYTTCRAMNKYFDYINTLPINHEFTNTVVERWHYRFNTLEFKYEHRNSIKHQNNTVGYLSSFSKPMTIDIIKDYGARRLLRECKSRPHSVFALVVLPYSEFPIHLDYHANRTSMVYNVMITGSDSSTELHDEHGCVFKFSGIHNYHFNPNRIVHGANTNSEPIQMLQFFYDAE